MEKNFKLYGDDKLDLDHCIFVNLGYTKIWPSVIEQDFNKDWHPYIERKQVLLGKDKFKKYLNFCSDYSNRFKNDYGVLTKD